MREIIQWKLSGFNKIFLIVLLLYSFGLIGVTAQSATIKGKIEDAATGETLIGANVLIQGTTKGAIADMDGFFMLTDVKSGSYNLVISYVSYEQQIQRIELNKGETLELNFKLQPSSVELNEVKITANKRTDTDLSLISSIRVGSLVANGISKQQISRSQDKDASEVIARVPGVTVRDGKFINVRGLDERYNVVWLNGIGAPSSEADRRAFSFDMLPSSLIDNMVVYKTPAPELPADFAGAVVQIQTKSTVDANSTDISYTTGYRERTTFKDFYTYKGGKYDWLGFDDGTRSLPSSFPSTNELRDLADNPTEADKQKITELGRSFNKIWNPEKANRVAMPDQSFMVTINRKMLAGKVSIGNVTSVGYSIGNQNINVFRAGYQAYDVIADHPDTSYYFNDNLYSTKTKLNGLFNWLFVFGNNQRIEFRNFFNQIGDKQTITRSGRDFYGGSYKTASELKFQSRSIYSTQVNGIHNFNNLRTNFNWTLGYGYTNKLQPDTRRIEKSRNEDAGASAPYTTSLNFNADPKMLGRLFLSNYEHLFVGVLNFSHKLELGNFTPEIKTGTFIELKNRSFTARNIGFARSTLDFNNNLRYQPIDSLFQDKNINYTDGIKVDESTNLSDSYNASNKLYTGYIAVNLPFRKLKVYAGVRIEENKQTLDGYDQNNAVVKVVNDNTDIFPSLNMTYNFTDKSLLRTAYGRTINRPEFREIAPFTYYNFEEKATIYGNPELTNSYINNAELRYEFFPANGDMITFGGFYKHFSNPIEAHLVEVGSGLNYDFSNALSAESYGLELDLRKSLSGLENNNSAIIRSFKDLAVIFNAAIIRSRLKSDDVNAREKVRQMQGQSPYILNATLLYDNSSKGLMIGASYNIIGERIAFVGNNSNPHIFEMPRSLLDITINKRIGKHFTLKGGIKDIFNQPVEFRQNESIQTVPNDPESKAKRVQKTQLYQPNSSFIIGFTMNI